MSHAKKTAKDVLEVVNPFDLKPIGSVPLTNWDSIDGYLGSWPQFVPQP